MPIVNACMHACVHVWVVWHLMLTGMQVKSCPLVYGLVICSSSVPYQNFFIAPLSKNSWGVQKFTIVPMEDSWCCRTSCCFCCCTKRYHYAFHWRNRLSAEAHSLVYIPLSDKLSAEDRSFSKPANILRFWKNPYEDMRTCFMTTFWSCRCVRSILSLCYFYSNSMANSMALTTVIFHKRDVWFKNLVEKLTVPDKVTNLLRCRQLTSRKFTQWENCVAK